MAEEELKPEIRWHKFLKPTWLSSEFASIPHENDWYFTNEIRQTLSFTMGFDFNGQQWHPIGVTEEGEMKVSSTSLVEQSNSYVWDGVNWVKEPEVRTVQVTGTVATDIQRPTTPEIFNITLTAANTEYAQALPTDTKSFLVQCRTFNTIKIAFNSGESGTKYLTIKPGFAYFEDSIKTSRTIYMQSPTAGVVVEIITWK